MNKIKLTEQDLTNIVKKVIQESDEQKKKLFVPRNIDKRADEYKEIIKKRLDKIRNTPLGKLSKEFIFEWIQENNLDQPLKLSYKGPTLGESSMTSYNVSTGEVILFFDDENQFAIRFKIKDIEIGTYDIDQSNGDNKFYPLD